MQNAKIYKVKVRVKLEWPDGYNHEAAMITSLIIAYSESEAGQLALRHSEKHYKREHDLGTIEAIHYIDTVEEVVSDNELISLNIAHHRGC